MKWTWVVWITLASIAIIAMVTLTFVNPTQTDLLPKCMLHEWTGLHCPGCGATRATHAILHGRFIDAITFNPVLVLGLPVFFLMQWRRQVRSKNGLPVSGRFPQIVCAIVIAFFVLRNIPNSANGWLAPRPWSSASEAATTEQIADD